MDTGIERKLMFKALEIYFKMMVLVFSLTACGKTAGTSNVSLKANPLAGSSAAMLSPLDHFFSILGMQSAHAAVSSFNAFSLCNDTLVITDSNGNTVSVNGSANQAGLGLLNFSPTATTPLALTSISIPNGTTIKEIDITSAVKPSACGGATYAVQFDPGSGVINITQNTSFKFIYSTPVTINNDTTLTLLFGAIVNAMVGQGAGLSNSSIQTVAALGTGK